MSLVLDLMCIAILAVALRRGWRRGIISMLVKVLGWIVAAVIIGSLYAKWEGTAVRILIALVVLSVCLAAARLVSGLLRQRGPADGIIGKAGRFLGAAVGAVLGMAAVYIFAVIVSMLADIAVISWLTPAVVDGSTVFGLLL